MEAALGPLLHGARRCAAALAVLIVGAGVHAADHAPNSAHAPRPAGVAWFEGSIAEAFARARQEHKPVFVYWGAIWCPPCLELKATIFKRPDFLARLRQFVPVYVDGDASGAQAIGDEFHVSGYPTVVVLRDDHTELERVSGGMDLSRYAEVLDLALGDVRPARALLDAEASAGTALGAGDCRRLAYNAWTLDEAWTLHPESLDTLALALDRAARQCPADARVERARLHLIAVHAAVDAEGARGAAGGKAAAPGAVLAGLLPAAAAVLADRDLALAAGDTLLELPAGYFTAAGSAAPDERQALLRRWFALMDALAQDQRYSAADQIDALRSKLVAAKALDTQGGIPPALANATRARVDAVLAAEHEPYARASVVNSALNALDALGDETRAAAILAGEVATAAQPYYYMADLAELEEHRGHRDAALDWYARSYRTAQGAATRFQWGAGYVRALLRLTPQDEAAIGAAAQEVLADLDASGDLHGRTRRALGRLQASLQQWNAQGAHAATLAALRQRLHGICAKLPAGDRESCGAAEAGFG